MSVSFAPGDTLVTTANYGSVAPTLPGVIIKNALDGSTIYAHTTVVTRVSTIGYEYSYEFVAPTVTSQTWLIALWDDNGGAQTLDESSWLVDPASSSSSSSGSTYTGGAVNVTTLGDRVRRAVNDYPAMDVTSGSATTTTTSLPVTNATAYKVGSTIVVDQEAMFVQDASGTNTGGTLTVVRAWQGSSAQSHGSSTPVLINPRFSPSLILDALNEGLRAIFPYWFQNIEDETITTTSYYQADYAMPAAFGTQGIVTNMMVLYPGLQNDSWIEWRWFRHLEGTSSRTISLVRVPPPGSTIRLIGLRPFEADMDYSGTTPVGLNDSCVPAILLYARYYLFQVGEAQRSIQQGGGNVGSAAVPPGAQQNMANVTLQAFLQYCNRNGQNWPRWKTRL